MKTKILLLAFIYIVNVCNTHAQNIFPSTGAAGIGTTTPNTSSLLEIKSTTKGLLIPRMTQAQRNAITSPATGLMIYQTNATPGFYYYGGGGWKSVAPKAWNLTGNAGTDSSINFIGTTDAHPLLFRVNNLKAGYIGYGKSNTSFGYQALSSNTSGNYNTATGTDALLTNTNGNNNIAYGSYSLLNNTTGSYNAATGADALHNNTTGSYNTANGGEALYNNAGNNNTAMGGYALYSNSSGYGNIALGYRSLYSSTTSFGLVAIGDSALYNNGIGAINAFDGADNTAIGSYALFSNTTGYENVANGVYALFSNTVGNGNIAEGMAALENNSSGLGNVSIGFFSGNSNNTGGDNTYVGDFAGPNDENFDNSTAIGNGSTVSSSNQIRLGNNFVTSIGGYTDWTNVSDGRVKKNIKQNVPGLAFINKLQPITYNLNLEAVDKIIQKQQVKDKNVKVIQLSENDLQGRKVKEQVVYTGFVAQDVEKAAKSLNYDFSGIDAAKNDKDLYGLRYAEFVVPLVKGEQELSKQNDSLKSIVSSLQSQINELKAMMVSGNQSAVSGQQLTVVSSASLEQNIPNPFTNNTTIGYSVPQKITAAQIIITDKSGKTLKAITISESGKGTVNVDASTLSSGAYQYSLVVDGKLIDTKQMVLAK